MRGSLPVARFGVVMPAANTTLEAELPSLAPHRFSWHFQRFATLVRSEADLLLGADAIAGAAADLQPARIAAVGVGYTAGSLIGGNEWDLRLRERIAASLDQPVVTAASAMLDALRELGAKRVAAVSPYAAAVNERLAAYLTQAGFEAVRVVGEPPLGPAGEVPMEQIEEMAMRLEKVESDAILVSCTGLRTMAVVERLERRLARPVVSSNQALAWGLMRAAQASPSGPGHLFASGDAAT